jgi:hypothetical protein
MDGTKDPKAQRPPALQGASRLPGARRPGSRRAPFASLYATFGAFPYSAGVLLMLLSIAARFGKPRFYVTRARISRALSVSPKTVSRALKVLKDARAISIRRRVRADRAGNMKGKLLQISLREGTIQSLRSCAVSFGEGTNQSLRSNTNFIAGRDQPVPSICNTDMGAAAARAFGAASSPLEAQDEQTRRPRTPQELMNTRAAADA